MGFTDWWEYSLWGAKRNGQNDGSRNIPGKTQKDHPAYERQLALGASKEIRSIAIEWENRDRSLKGHYVAALRQYLNAQKRSQKETGEAEAVLQKHRQVKENLIDSSDDPHLGRKAYGVILGLIAFGEIPLTAQVFEIFGENKILTYVFALVLCVSVPTTAHFVGLIIKENEENFNKKNLAILLTNGVVLICTLGVVSWLREKYFEAEGQQLLGIQMDPRMVTLVFFAIQLLIFTTAATASYFAHDAHPGRKRAIRETKSTTKDVIKETNEAEDAEKILDSSAANLARLEAEREKIFSTYQNRAEEIMDDCKLRIEAYRGANMRARGDAEIACFNTYPAMTIPTCLQELDKECGFSVPEASPTLCSMCGETNPFSAIRCKKCGNDIR